MLVSGLTEDAETDRAAVREAMGPPEPWLRRYFAATLAGPTGDPVPFAPHHHELWAWVWALERGTRPQTFIGVWPRGGGKSSSAELAVVAMGTRGARKYVLYISSSQAQADDHVQSIGALLESADFSRDYPEVGSRRLGKYGSSQGWRRNRLRTASGFTVDALGLDTAARGAKLENFRPDLFVLDDLDSETDTLAAVEKKIAILTRKLLPAGSPDLAVLAIQNLVHPDSIFSQLTDGRADFLRNRIVSGPLPALTGMTHEERDGRPTITGGTPTWEGQSLSACQALLDDIGLTAFLAEVQQETSVLREHIFDLGWWADGRNRYLHSAPLTFGEIEETWITVDTAQKDGEEHDFSAFGVWQVLQGGRLRLREIRQAKLQFPDLLTAIEDIAAEYYPTGLLRGVRIEDKVSGTGAYQTLKASARYPWLRSMVGAWNPPGSKPYRARRASVWCARDMIELPHPEPSAPWVLGFERELRDFPNVPHDDATDVFTMGILLLENYLSLAWARQLAISAPAGAAR